MANYQHLNISKAPLQNERRTRRVNMPRIHRGDLRQHRAHSLELVQ